jgi:hypothetical protein
MWVMKRIPFSGLIGAYEWPISNLAPHVVAKVDKKVLKFKIVEQALENRS